MEDEAATGLRGTQRNTLKCAHTATDATSGIITRDPTFERSEIVSLRVPKSSVFEFRIATSFLIGLYIT
jgi:hypothetical protein